MTCCYSSIPLLSLMLPLIVMVSITCSTSDAQAFAPVAGRGGLLTSQPFNMARNSREIAVPPPVQVSTDRERRSLTKDFEPWSRMSGAPTSHKGSQDISFHDLRRGGAAAFDNPYRRFSQHPSSVADPFPVTNHRTNQKNVLPTPSQHPSVDDPFTITNPGTIQKLENLNRNNEIVLEDIRELERQIQDRIRLVGNIEELEEKLKDGRRIIGDLIKLDDRGDRRVVGETIQVKDSNNIGKFVGQVIEVKHEMDRTNGSNKKIRQKDSSLKTSYGESFFRPLELDILPRNPYSQSEEKAKKSSHFSQSIEQAFDRASKPFRYRKHNLYSKTGSQRSEDLPELAKTQIVRAVGINLQDLITNSAESFPLSKSKLKELFEESRSSDFKNVKNIPKVKKEIVKISVEILPKKTTENIIYAERMRIPSSGQFSPIKLPKSNIPALKITTVNPVRVLTRYPQKIAAPVIAGNKSKERTPLRNNRTPAIAKFSPTNKDHPASTQLEAIRKNTYLTIMNRRKNKNRTRENVRKIVNSGVLEGQRNSSAPEYTRRNKYSNYKTYRKNIDSSDNDVALNLKQNSSFSIEKLSAVKIPLSINADDLTKQYKRQSLRAQLKQPTRTSSNSNKTYKKPALKIPSRVESTKEKIPFAEYRNRFRNQLRKQKTTTTTTTTTKRTPIKLSFAKPTSYSKPDNYEEKEKPTSYTSGSIEKVVEDLYSEGKARPQRHYKSPQTPYHSSGYKTHSSIHPHAPSPYYMFPGQSHHVQQYGAQGHLHHNPHHHHIHHYSGSEEHSNHYSSPPVHRPHASMYNNPRVPVRVVHVTKTVSDYSDEEESHGFIKSLFRKGRKQLDSHRESSNYPSYFEKSKEHKSYFEKSKEHPSFFDKSKPSLFDKSKEHPSLFEKGEKFFKEKFAKLFYKGKGDKGEKGDKGHSPHSVSYIDAHPSPIPGTAQINVDLRHLSLGKHILPASFPILVPTSLDSALYHQHHSYKHEHSYRHEPENRRPSFDMEPPPMSPPAMSPPAFDLTIPFMGDSFETSRSVEFSKQHSDEIVSSSHESDERDHSNSKEFSSGGFEDDSIAHFARTANLKNSDMDASESRRTPKGRRISDDAREPENEARHENEAEFENEARPDYESGFENEARHENEAGQEIEAGLDYESGFENEARPDYEAGFETGAGPDYEAGFENEARHENEAGFENEARADYEAGPEIEAGRDYEAGFENEARQEIIAGPDFEAGVDYEAGFENEARQENEAGPDFEAGVDYEAGFEREIGIETQLEHETGPHEIETGLEHEIEPRTVPEPHGSVH